VIQTFPMEDNRLEPSCGKLRESSNYVAGGPRLPHAAPIGVLACHCIELSLKAVLLSKSAPPEMIKGYGHNLKKLFAASDLNWSDVDADALDFYNDAVLEHAYRYRNSSRPYMMEPKHLLPIMEKVFHRCLNVVAPTAERSLVP
jgi:HEPN domain-containing protein